MIILQTAGSGHGGGIGLGSDILGVESQCTTFRENEYIHKLNRLLQSEMRAVSAYNGLLGRVDARHPFNRICDDHREAGKSLVRLVILNRGIPEEKTAISVGFTKTFFTLCSSLPGRLFESATYSSLDQVERRLLNRYESLLDLAPSRDLESLKSLLAQAERRGDDLRTLFQKL